MQIKTIAEFQAADPKAIEEIKDKITIVQDMLNFRHWIENNDALVDISFKIDAHRSLCVHPSSVCKVGSCPLKIYYECTGELDKNKCHSLDLHNTFDTGTALHAVVQTYCERIYNDDAVTQFQKEVKLAAEEFHMHGSADGLFTFSDHRFILEIKTIKEGGNSGWEKVQVRPLPDNERQLRLYMHMCNVPFGLVYYWCKNTGAVKEHVVTYDGGVVWNEVASFLKPVVDAAYNKGPPVEGTVGSMCRMCDYNYGCRDFRRKNETITSRDRRAAVHRTV